MPIFEYECRECHHQFEQLVLKGDTPSCPACKATDLDRLLSITSVSTDGTKERNLGRAKQAAKRIQRDKAHAEHEAYHHHHH